MRQRRVDPGCTISSRTEPCPRYRCASTRRAGGQAPDPVGASTAGPLRREIMMVIDGADPFATAKPDPPLSKLLTRARRFNTTLIGSDGVPFAAPAERESVSPSYFTRLVRLS